MIDSVGIYAGIQPTKLSKEHTYFEMSAGGCMFENIKNNNIRDPAEGIYEPIEKPPRDFNMQPYRSTLKQVLPCKGQPESIKYSRPELPKNAWMYPNQGYARHQEKGLAIDHFKPMNTNVMPKAGFYNPNMLNVLGNFK